MARAKIFADAKARVVAGRDTIISLSAARAWATRTVGTKSRCCSAVAVTWRDCLRWLHAPVPMPAQIAVLLALNANLFDAVPLERMTDAGQALLEAAARIAPEIAARCDSSDTLSDEDRESIIDIARHALEPFLQARPGGENADKSGGSK